MSIFTCMYICALCMQCPWKPESDVRYPEIGVTENGRHHMGAGNLVQVCWNSSQCSNV